MNRVKSIFNCHAGPDYDTFEICFKRFLALIKEYEFGDLAY